MCGINGVVDLIDRLPNGIELVEKMNLRTAHRGPDNAAAVQVDNRTYLGHVRLSIIDLSANGNQPFCKNGLSLVFNGEIYNFKELRQQLPADVKMNSESDTEVLLELWRIYGVECINMLRGMFAFAIHDSSNEELYLVRDHFGIKPLFYSQNDKEFIFSSELKAIESVWDTPKALNKSAVLASTSNTWVPEDICMYLDIKKLLPGHYLKLEANNTTTVQCYWSTSELIAKPTRLNTENAAVEKLNSALLESVEKHLVADVPVSAFLSGGLDSSLIVAMANHLGCNPDCYTIKFSEEEDKVLDIPSDALYAKKVADKLGVKLTTIKVEPNMLELLPKIVDHLDEPVGDSAAVNTFLICDAAQRLGVKVLLSGMGADEMLSGYRKHYANKLAQQYRKLPGALRSLNKSVIDLLPLKFRGRGLKISRWAKRFSQIADAPFSDAFLRSYTYYDLDDLASHMPAVKKEDVLKAKHYHHSILEHGLKHRGVVDAMCFTDINNFMASLTETYTDRASMAASTEVRVPFIDKKVMEVAFDIHESLKLKGREQKYILKKVAEKWLPQDVIYRPKSHFTMPLRSWVANDLTDVVDEYLLSETGLFKRNIFEAKYLSQIVDDERNGKADNAQKIWQLLTLEQWLRNRGIEGAPW